MFKAIVIFFLISSNIMFSNIDSLRKSLENKPDSVKFKEYNLYASSLVNSNPKASLDILLSISELSKKIKESEKLARYYFNLAFAYDYLENLDSALINYYLSLNILRDIKAKVGINHCLNNIGIIYKKKNNYIAALKAYREAYDFAKNNNNTPSMLSVINNIANIYLDLKDYEKMKETLDKGLEISIESNDTLSRGFIYSNIGNYYNLVGNYTKAKQFCEKGFTYLKLTDRLDLITSNRNLLARILISQNETSRALPLLKFAETYADSLKNDLLISNIYNTYGSYYTKSGDFKQSIDYNIKSLEISKNLNNTFILKNLYDNIADNYFALGDFENAYKYLDTLINLTDSLNKIAVVSEIAQASLSLEGDFNAERVVKYREEVKSTKEENALIKKYLNEITVYLYIIGLLALFLLGLTAMLVFKAKQLKRTNEALSLSEKNLMDLNATKDKFFSIIAHDLRGPMGGTKMILDQMNIYRDDFTDIEKQEIIKELAVSSAEMLNLLENLLLWSTAQRNTLEINQSRFNANAAVQSTIDLLITTANNKNITINNYIDENLVIDNDVNLFDTLIRNTVNNSIKFTNSGGKIELFNELNGSQAVFIIKDNGVGIDEIDLDNLFRIDYKKPEIGTNGERGTGLGLIICKEFSQIMGGDISISSKSGEGTTVKISLPLTVHNN